MGAKDNQEFKYAIRDIANHASQLDNPFDRVRCVEWVRKLMSLPDDHLESCKLRNEYAQLLRIQVKNKVIHGPFNSPPPEQSLCCLAECLGKTMVKQVTFLPKMGPITPMLQHKSPDGKAYISAKQIPGGGVFCYMAVSPNKMAHNIN